MLRNDHSEAIKSRLASDVDLPETIHGVSGVGYAGAATYLN